MSDEKPTKYNNGINRKKNSSFDNTKYTTKK